jgi:hypothetical protein
MNNDVFTISGNWSIAEMSAMTMDGDLFNFNGVFTTWWFLETPMARLEVLRLVYRRNCKPVGATASWVANGGKMPKEIELQQPRRYC